MKPPSGIKAAASPPDLGSSKKSKLPFKTFSKTRNATNPSAMAARFSASNASPYKLYYFHEPELITIYAVLHDRRKPDVWRDRLG